MKRRDGYTQANVSFGTAVFSAQMVDDIIR